MRGASPRGIRSNRLWSGCFPRQPHNTAFLHPALSSWCSPTERCLLEEMGSFSPYIWFTQTAVVPKHLFCTYLLAAFPLKAGKYFFFNYLLQQSFRTCWKDGPVHHGLLQWCVLAGVFFINCSSNVRHVVFREGIEQLLSCVGIQYYEHFPNSSTWFYEKKRGYFSSSKTSIRPCLCIFSINSATVWYLLKYNPFVQVAVLIATFILSHSGHWASKTFWKDLRRGAG